MRFLFLSVAFSVGMTMFPAWAIDLAQVEQELKGAGAVGWVHGAVGDRSLFVFTYRNPDNFFDYVDMSLTTQSAEVLAQLKSLGRHDRISVKGSFLDNPSPQKHIDATEITIVEKWNSGIETQPYDYDAKIPDELLSQSSAEFLVHAIGGGGKILVLEFKDQIVPVYVRKPELAQGLYRNDVVRVHYRIAKDPDRPTHLRIDDTAAQPIQVLDSILALHGKPADVEGALILFPQAPGIRFNVFAVQQVLRAGLKRQFTVLNFDNPEVFRQVREKLQTAWDQFPSEFDNGRNKLVHRKVHVRVKGIFHEIDPNQANAQILVDSPDQIEVLIK